MSGHLTLTSLVATYENHSCKQPAPVTDTSRVFTQKAVEMSSLTLQETLPSVTCYTLTETSTTAIRFG